MTLFFERFDPSSTLHQDSAGAISSWTQGEHMLLLTPDSMAAHVLGILAFNGDSSGDRELAGYRAVTQDYGNETYEVGAMVIDPEARGKGYGSQIAEALVEEARRVLGVNAILVAFCNTKSAGISRRLGFADANVEDVPAAALNLCTVCPAYQAREVGQLCCDTILILKPEVKIE